MSDNVEAKINAILVKESHDLFWEVIAGIKGVQESIEKAKAEIEQLTALSPGSGARG